MIVETPERGEKIIESDAATDRLQTFFEELERQLNDLEDRIEDLEEA